MRLIVLLFLLVGLCGCGWLVPDGPRMPEPADGDGNGIAGQPEDGAVPGVMPVVPPPDATIDGVAGHPVSWCWGGACVDGFVTIAGANKLPGVSDPSVVQVPPGTMIESAQVWGAGGQDQSMTVAFEGLTLASLPDDAVILLVSIRAGSGEDVTYAWHVVEPEASVN
jgi:hypothetical protein